MIRINYIKITKENFSTLFLLFRRRRKCYLDIGDFVCFNERGVGEAGRGGAVRMCIWYLCVFLCYDKIIFGKNVVQFTMETKYPYSISSAISAINFFNCADRFSRAACFSERSNISDSKSSKRAFDALARTVAADESSTADHFVTAIGSDSSSRRLDNF